MNRRTDRKIILVTRPTRLAELITRFNTVSQARFYVEHQGADFSDYVREDETYHRALDKTQSTLAEIGLVQVVDRSFLPNFVFGPDDTIVALGQDGLVANTLKYLQGQPVIGVNPDPERWDGKLLPFRVSDLSKMILEAVLRKRPMRAVTMAKAALNNGQTLYGVNDLFIGPKSHISARYLIKSGDTCEQQSSSGVIVSTGLGSTGWLKSLLTGAAAISQSASLTFPFSQNAGAIEQMGDNAGEKPPINVRTNFPWDANYLFYTVREPFPTNTTQTSLVFGSITPETPLVLESRMAENGVIFSDGMEKDFLDFNSGTQALISIAERKGFLVE